MTHINSTAGFSAACISALLLAGCGGGDSATPLSTAPTEQALRGGGGNRTLFETTAVLGCSGAVTWSVTLQGMFQFATVRVYALPGFTLIPSLTDQWTPRTTNSLRTTFEGTFAGLNPSGQYTVQFRRFLGGEGKIDEEVWVPTGACR